MVRIASVVVLLPLVVALIYRGGIFGAALMAVAAGACAGEYYRIVFGKLEPSALLGVGAAALLPLWPVLVPAREGEAALGTLAFVFLAAWVVPLLRGTLSDAPLRASHFFMGVGYGGVGLYALSVVRAGVDGLGWLIAALTVTWCNDTMAYFAGRLFGRRKLYPEVSPNKTWEGFAGGLVGSVCVKISIPPSLPGGAIQDT